MGTAQGRLFVGEAFSNVMCEGLSSGTQFFPFIWTMGSLVKPVAREGDLGRT